MLHLPKDLKHVTTIRKADGCSSPNLRLIKKAGGESVQDSVGDAVHQPRSRANKEPRQAFTPVEAPMLPIRWSASSTKPIRGSSPRFRHGGADHPFRS